MDTGGTRPPHCGEYDYTDVTVASRMQGAKLHRTDLRLDFSQLRRAFGRDHGLIDRNLLPTLQHPAGPSNPDLVHHAGFSQSEMQSQTVLRVIATTAHDLADHLSISKGNLDSGPDCGT